MTALTHGQQFKARFLRSSAPTSTDGIEIATNVAGADLSEPRFRPIFARAEELGLVLFMHPTGFPEASRFRDHYFTNIIGNPLDTTVAVHHLIFGGVLQDYPNLKLVLSHGGGYLPAYSGRIDHAASARPDTCTCIRHMPTTYLKRLYFDTIVYTHDQLQYLVEQYGADPGHLSVYQTFPELREREAFEEKLDGAPEATGEPGKPSASELGRLAVRVFFSAGVGLLAWSHMPVETAQ